MSDRDTHRLSSAKQCTQGFSLANRKILIVARCEGVSRRAVNSITPIPTSSSRTCLLFFRCSYLKRNSTETLHSFTIKYTLYNKRPFFMWKTCPIMKLLEHPNGLKLENVYVFYKTTQQEKYRRLETTLSVMERIQYFPFTNKEDIVPHNETLLNSVFIFDNVWCEPQGKIQKYFCFGRHSNFDCFYLSQSCAHIPKHWLLLLKLTI
ncbi:hypothetical protein PR048_016556 [Dryococelus australis]|uniref:Uncharacterized protein n=1 Tax=Dryococelus australis TaxID=614101 RepID=A0ABQ9HK29_9NEOP|nr:hypothetical protein PR048_016556 [Dryococelus australis]